MTSSYVPISGDFIEDMFDIDFIVIQISDPNDLFEIFSHDDESIEIYSDMGSSDQQSSTNDDFESTEINQVIEQSMQHFIMVPATEKAMAASLKKMEKLDDNIKTSTCSICLEAFDVDEEGDDISALPCDHFFHDNCIVGWLKMGHTCPLCRFQLPM
ncbi:hypothetical protein QN277_024593 [Acacia crassicarpa]|uniref:RING-type E3 ubiquitin transferase n=1 Tax=Acacia crassicarpa TaxID=499986 RepID=A0AAE1JCD8_9FABA|nr:hypothetical protein QN277_024593 [Acacia crassicarpa]